MVPRQRLSSKYGTMTHAKQWDSHRVKELSRILPGRLEGIHVVGFKGAADAACAMLRWQEGTKAHEVAPPLTQQGIHEGAVP